MYALIVRLFDALDAFFLAISRVVRSALGRLWDRALVPLIAGLIIVLTGVGIVVGGALSRLDRGVAWVERTLIALAMLSMVALSFHDYLVQEWKVGGAGIVGGPNMGLVLMVWVGFLGASLATRNREHLAVDLTDRLLSPASAGFVKRFTSLIAAGLAWMFAGGAWDLTKESIEFGDAVDALPVWDWLVAPLNFFIGLLPGQPTESTPWPVVTAGGGFPLWIAQSVLPFGFLVIALRFLGAAIFGVPVAPQPGEPPAPTRRRADLVMAGLFPGVLLGIAAVAKLGTGWVIAIAAVVSLLLGAPLFVGVGIGALASAQLIGGYDAVSVVTDMFEATKKPELLSIPFFVLAGNLMTQGAIADRLVAIARAVMGRTPGGLGLAAILSCVIFAAISGSSPVTVIAVGSVMFPMLVKGRYKERYSLGVLSSAGSLGIIIPPSVPMIVYAIVVSSPTASVSPSDLFLAGVLPGLFIAGMLAVYTLYATRGTPIDQEVVAEGYWRGVGLALKRGIWSLGLPVLILGGIYGVLTLEPLGIDFAIRFTVTQAAAVSVVYALLVELFIHRELKWKKVPGVLAESGTMMGGLFLILVLAIALNRFLALQEIPQHAADWVLSHVQSQLEFLIWVNLFLLVLGCLMDIMSAILIVAPLLAPIAVQYGIHPVHFGIIFIVNLELGYLTPPMGINLFVASTVFKRPLIEVIRGVVPFLLVMLFALIVISWWPWLSLALLSE